MIQLDFKLEWRDERAEYVRQHVANASNLSSSDLTSLSDYILWGKNRETGLNGLQEGLDLNSKWNQSSSQIESLDALIESPTFNENSLRRPTEPPTKVQRVVFSRASTRKNCPSHLLGDFEALWRQIDETELLIQTYELQQGRRKTPIRDDLLHRFTSADIEALAHKASTLSSYHYLKLKRELVDLRTQQYIMRDSYQSTLLSNPTPNLELSDPMSFGDEIEIRPLSPTFDPLLFRKIWREDRFPEPSDFNDADLSQISALLWRPSSPFYFDFCNRDHLYTLFGLWHELENASDEGSNYKLLKQMLESYKCLAHLEPIHSRILALKIRKESNQLIADKIEAEFGRHYSPNYISTLYCAKSLQGICDAAAMHRQIMENIFFPENFKVCKDCGRTLLLNENNFVRRQRSNDGFSPRCKACEKLKRKENQK